MTLSDTSSTYNNHVEKEKKRGSREQMLLPLAEMTTLVTESQNRKTVIKGVKNRILNKKK